MSTKPSPFGRLADDLATAFGLLQEALEGEAAQVAQRIAKAAEARRYDEVRELNEQAELLGGITEEVRDLSKRWTPLVPEPPEQDQTGIRLVLRHKGCDARAMSLEPIECPYEDLRAAILSVIEKRDRTPTSRESGG